jgi:hypothetical protein
MNRAATDVREVVIMARVANHGMGGFDTLALSGVKGARTWVRPRSWRAL